MLAKAIFPSLAVLAASLRAPAVPVVRSAVRSARPLLMAADDEFSFGDAGDVSTETAQALVVEERELTEREKEIARLRAAEKFMLKETGDAKCKVCNYKYKWEEGAMPQIP